MRSDLRRLLAISRKELITFTSYRVSMLMRFFDVWYFAISFYFISEFFGAAEAIRELDGGYFEFVLIGSIVTSFAVVGLTSFSDQIGEEQDEGTLEAVLATPTPMWTIVVGSFVVPAIFVVIETVVLVAVGLGVFGAGVPVRGLLLSIPLLILTTLSYAPLGILSAAFIVLVKRGEPFSGPARQLTLLLSGALYPTSVLPGWLEAVTNVVPATHGLAATRDLVLGRASILDVVPELVLLSAFAGVTTPVALAVFRRAVSAARRAGTLATY